MTTLSQQIPFNAFDLVVFPEAWTEYSIYRRHGKIDKALRAEIARLWREGKVISEFTEKEESWIISSQPDFPEVEQRGYRKDSINSAPLSVALSYVITMKSGTPAGANVYLGPNRKMWEAKRNEVRGTMICLRPSFSVWERRVVINVSATALKVAGDEKRRNPVQVFVHRESNTFASDGYRFPARGEVVQEPPLMNAKVSIPWTPIAPCGAPLASKVDLLHWLLDQANQSGMVAIRPANLEATPARFVLGARGQDSKLKKAKLKEAILAAIPARLIHLYDRRSDADNSVPWPLLADLMRNAVSELGFEIVDHARDLYQDFDGPIFVAIDRQDVFDEDDEDTKPAVVASFPRPVQCWSSDIVSEDKESNAVISEATVLVMLANQVMKLEVAGHQLMMPRDWLEESLLGSVSHYVFCDEFDFGEDVISLGIQVKSSGMLQFFEAPSRGLLYETVVEKGLTPVFRIQTEKDRLPTDFGQAIEIRTLDVRALPFLSRDGMTQHYSGVRLLSDNGCYYASGSERPARVKVERALVLRHVSRVGDQQDSDLEMMAGLCVDPTIRINAATVWPAPFKLLREYALTSRVEQSSMLQRSLATSE